MPWYRARIRGENFFMQFDEEVKRLGFFTNRFIEGSNSSEVEERAIAQIRDDPKLKNGLLNGVEDPPMIFVDEIVEVDADTVPEIRPGFAFFPAANDA